MFSCPASALLIVNDVARRALCSYLPPFLRFKSDSHGLHPGKKLNANEKESAAYYNYDVMEVIS